MALAGHEEVSLADEGLIVEPVDVEAVDGDGVVLAIDGHALEPALLVVAQLVADALIHVSSLNDLHGVRVQLAHSRYRVVPLVEVVGEGKLGRLRPGSLGESVLGQHVLVSLEPETCHLYTL